MSVWLNWKWRKSAKLVSVNRQSRLNANYLTPFYERAKRSEQSISKLTNISSTDLRLLWLRKALKYRANSKTIENRIGRKPFEWFTPKPRTNQRKTSKPRKKLTAEQIERKERWNIANKARKEAVANGLTEFMAVCGHHGETQYTLGSKGQARCMACMKEKSVKYNSAKQTPEQKAKFERQTKNKRV